MESKNPQPDQSCRPVFPFLTPELDGLGGRIKTTVEDFVVEELPKYEFCGEGTHVYAFVQKSNMTTTDMIGRIADAMGVARRDVGYAGRKDAKAVTRQWISIEHVDPEKVKDFSSTNIRVLDVRRHGNKLKVGHLAGNRFMIRLRTMNRPAAEALVIAKKVMDVLSSKGVPNYFGPQRFGYRYDSHLLGAAIVKHDLERFYDILLGESGLDSQDEFIAARKLYEEGDLDGAYQAWHPAFHDHRKAIKNLIKFGGDRKKAFRIYDRHLKSLLVSAWQSDLFNRVLAARMPEIDVVLDGDMAYKHANGACFQVEDAGAEQARCGAFEISATGPLVGKKMKALTGAAGAIENSLIEAVDITADDFPRLKKYGGIGGRRPLRFQPKHYALDMGTDEGGEYLELTFDLPSGCYATVLLREITKCDL